MPGPMPKRSDMRIRRNKPENEGGVPLSRGTAMGFTAWAAPGEDWDESVIRLYNSFRNSGMVSYYEDTDVQMIWQACDQMQVHRDGRRSAQGFDFIMKALDRLGATEDARRRMRIELVAPQEEEQDAPELALVYDFKDNPAITGVSSGAK